MSNERTGAIFMAGGAIAMMAQSCAVGDGAVSGAAWMHFAYAAVFMIAGAILRCAIGRK